MIRRFVCIILATPVMFAAVSAFGQTTYTSTKPFICDMASAHPVTSFSQFSCRGITIHDANNTLQVEYFFRDSPNWFDLYTANGDVVRPPQTGTNYMTQLTTFTDPASGQPGTYAFNWTLTDAAGTVHTGRASGTWQDVQICGGRGCYWHAPELLSNSITINN